MDAKTTPQGVIIASEFSIRHYPRIAAICVCLPLLAGSAWGQARNSAETQWRALNQPTVATYNAGDYRAAETAAQKTLEFARTAFGERHPNTIASLNNLARPIFTAYARTRAYAVVNPCSPDVIADQTIALDGYYTSQDYPAHLRRIRFKDPDTGKTLVFLTNHVTLPALTVCALYKSRWQVELFFKWIKQHLRIKRFYGTSENAVKTQIWIAVSVYVLIAIVKRRLRLEASLYTLLQVLSVTIFEKMPIQTALSSEITRSDSEISANQLNLFAF